MSGTPDYLIDGDFSRAKALGPRRFEYPFRKNGDRVSALFEEDYWQTKATFTPEALKTEHEQLSGYYLVAESEPVEMIANILKFTRLYARVPVTQTVPGSLWVTKPELTGTFPQVINGSLVTQPDETKEEYSFSSRVAVTNDSGAPASSTTGGTFTLSFDGDTTAGIAYNASAATVEGDLDGEAAIAAYGGVAVTGSHTAGYVVDFSYAAATVNIGSLTIAGGTASTSVVRTESGLTQAIQIIPAWTSAVAAITSSLTPAEVNPPYIVNYTGSDSGDFLFGIGRNGFGAATGGTFTITVYGQTTGSLNWNDSSATIQTALNALSEASDRGNYTVTGGIANSADSFTYSRASLPDPALTGGTFTITLFGDTTGTIAYNASLSTISTAVNALAGVTARGGAVISGAGFAGGKQSFVITFANIPLITGSAASLTPSGTINISASSNRGHTQTISFTTSPSTVRYVTTGAVHGISASDDIYVDETSVAAGGFSVIDTYTIALNSSSGILSSASTFAYIGKVVGVNYVAGPKETRCNYVTDFYLPGVTAGITTAADIPIPDYHGDDDALKEAIFAGTTEININTGQLAQWRDTPILARTITKINAALL